jgi:WD40 repeat protein
VAWDLRVEKAVRAMETDERVEQMCVNVGGDGRVFVSGGVDETVRLWDWRTGICVSEGVGHSGRVARVRMDHTGERVVSCAPDEAIFMWSVYNAR